MPQIRTVRTDLIRSTWSAHAWVIGLTRRRSGLWWLSTNARPTKLGTRVATVDRASRCSGFAPSCWHRRQMVRIDRRAAGEHCAHDARVLVGQRHHRLLPADALFQMHRPPADAVAAFGRGHADQRRSRATPGRSLVASSITVHSTVRSASGLRGKLRPNSATSPQMRLSARGVPPRTPRAAGERRSGPAARPSWPAGSCAHQARNRSDDSASASATCPM